MTASAETRQPTRLRAAVGVIATASAVVGGVVGLLFVLAIDSWRDSSPDAAGSTPNESWTDGLPLGTYVAVLLFVALVGAAYIALVVLRRRPGFASRGALGQGLIAWLAGLAVLAVLAPLIGLMLGALS